MPKWLSTSERRLGIQKTLLYQLQESRSPIPNMMVYLKSPAEGRVSLLEGLNTRATTIPIRSRGTTELWQHVAVTGANN